MHLVTAPEPNTPDGKPSGMAGSVCLLTSSLHTRQVFNLIPKYLSNIQRDHFLVYLQNLSPP
jgi:hypothetical protein